MKKNIGIIGCGYWGKNLVRNFYELEALKTICDLDKDRLTSLKEKYPNIEICDDYQTLLKDTDIKGLVISTPAITHYPLVKEALLAGKDVFVEKPISLKYTEGRNLVSIAQEKNKILMVGHILEYHPAVIKLKELIDNGELGKISYIYSNRLNLGKFRTEENILWSFAPHDISTILYLLNETPIEVSAHGGNYLNPDIADITVTNFKFQSGVKAHIFVSWLHPYKEQKLIVIGDKGMVLFDDMNTNNKLLIFNHKIEWKGRLPIPFPHKATPIKIENQEPLKSECIHFLECISSRKIPKTDGHNGIRVLKILEDCQKSLYEDGKVQRSEKKEKQEYFVHESSYIDDDVKIGKGSKIWHFSHVLKNSKLGKGCNIGQNVVIGPNVSIGNNVKIQNNVSIYTGVTLKDDVFCGPSMVFTNVMNPRSHWPRKDEYKETVVGQGASLGANSTIVCGIRIGKYAFIGAGALVNKDVPDYALAYGVPAKIQGWMCYCGIKLKLSNSIESHETKKCTACGRSYKKDGNKVVEIKKE